MSTPQTLLVANRGEIAVRILRSARELGWRTVAVFSEADRGAPHVRLADDAVCLGPAPAAESYLRADAVVAAALAHGATMIHPGYGFLSENAAFARACEAAGITFAGPTPDQLELFGAKHSAREAAATAGVAMLPGSGLLDDLATAHAEAERVGYPVMLKATAGGGGIGMQACADADALTAAWDSVRRLAENSFTSGGVFLERCVPRARHVEVQVFGDGKGRVLTLGDRDCSLQRRHQKVVEESPAPGLDDAAAAELAEAAARLCRSVSYRSAGTVEFIHDPDRGESWFLEVNTRLQVEHPVTEARFGIDLVGWMLRLAAGEDVLAEPVPTPTRAAVEARIYAENPDRDHLPSAGRITAVDFPDEVDGSPVRVDTWIETGSEITTAYDPMLAKVIVTGATRAQAWARLGNALARTRVQGVATNLGLLRSVVEDADVQAARHSTSTLAGLRDTTPRLEVLDPGLLATVQDWPGRVGFWSVGIPPSGPMDDLSFRLGNRALGNPEGAPGLELTLGPSRWRAHGDLTICLTGAPAEVTVDGRAVAQWEPVVVPSGAVVHVALPERGMRGYLLVRGGFDVAEVAVLGSAATFDLGELGGPSGRALAPGDALPVATPSSPDTGAAPGPIPLEQRPVIDDDWSIGVLEGPHAAGEFFRNSDIETLHEATYRVHFNSARTGVRLVGPKPRWARSDGGEAGLHPSNIHDTAYSVGALDFTGDLPILLGPDGPSLGGFVCPVTVALGHRWKLGQLRPDDTVRFVPITDGAAKRLRSDPTAPVVADRAPVVDGGILLTRPASAQAPSLTLRRSGDERLLVEYGPMRLDVAVRMRIHALAERLRADEVAGIVELSPGIRSVQVQFDPDVTTPERLIAAVVDADAALGDTRALRVPSRTVRLPLSWDDPSVEETIRRYVNGVRDDAPWSPAENPSNIEFIRRVNGLESHEEVRRIVFDASYLVLGLGDVYLGAPVATPLDPRHRLVTTKYNPARTWTPPNMVGIGGSYLCVYGMEGPGGYQLVGRTVPVWSTWQQRGSFEPGVPWLLRFFDRIQWYPVTAEELTTLRADQAAGRWEAEIVEGEFGVAEYEEFLATHAESIEAFTARRDAAFAEERRRWEAAGEFDRADAVAEAAAPAGDGVVPDGCVAVRAAFAATVFRVDVGVGDRVAEGATLVAVEAMKMESAVVAPVGGEVVEVRVVPGGLVAPNSVLVVLRPQEAA